MLSTTFRQVKLGQHRHDLNLFSILKPARHNPYFQYANMLQHFLNQCHSGQDKVFLNLPIAIMRKLRVRDV